MTHSILPRLSTMVLMTKQIESQELRSFIKRSLHHYRFNYCCPQVFINAALTTYFPRPLCGDATLTRPLRQRGAVIACWTFKPKSMIAESICT